MQEQSPQSPYLSFGQLPVLVPQHTLMGAALFLQGRFSCLCALLHSLQLLRAPVVLGRILKDYCHAMFCHMQDPPHTDNIGCALDAGARMR